MVPIMSLGESRAGCCLHASLHGPSLSVLLSGCEDEVLSHNRTLLAEAFHCSWTFSPILKQEDSYVNSYVIFYPVVKLLNADIFLQEETYKLKGDQDIQ